MSEMDWLGELLSGTRELIWSLPDGQFAPDLPEPPGSLLCGAFDPLHDGHRSLLQIAERALDCPVGYELSAFNVEKPALSREQLHARSFQFNMHPLAITAAPTFAEKAAVLPETTFVIGVDTAIRVVDPRFYLNSVESMHRALQQIRDQGCQFLVAGRLIDECFTTLVDVQIPERFDDLFLPLTEDEFRADISSTELRRNT